MAVCVFAHAGKGGLLAGDGDTPCLNLSSCSPWFRLMERVFGYTLRYESVRY